MLFGVGGFLLNLASHLRNIQNGLFGWYEKGAMKKIEDTLEFKKQMACKMVYIAICSLSASKKNTSKIECYKFDIARYASVSEKTVQRYLPELEKLGIISLSPQDRKSNGKYSKVKIWLKENNLPAGHLGESCEKVVGKLLDSKSDTINKERKEIKERNIESGEKISLTPSQIAKKFFNSKEEQENLVEFLVQEKNVDRKTCKQEIDKFVSYWTERNKSGTKQRWQMEKTFELNRRLSTWFGRAKDFSNTQKKEAKTIKFF